METSQPSTKCIRIPLPDRPPSYTNIYGADTEDLVSPTSSVDRNIVVQHYNYGESAPIHYMERSFGEDEDEDDYDHDHDRNHGIIYYTTNDPLSHDLDSIDNYSPLSGVSHRRTKRSATLSSSIPFQLPFNEGDDSRKNNIISRQTTNVSVSSTWLESMGHSFPNNMIKIDSNEIISPEVDSVESRFQISIEKFPKNGNGSRSYSISHQSSGLKNRFSFRRRRESHIIVNSSNHVIVEGEEFDYNKNTFDQKYEYTNTILGEGAGGSVKVVKRLKDSKLFAVKEFHPFENEPTDLVEQENEPKELNLMEERKNYLKKIKAEYCISSILKHENIIETIEIIELVNTITQDIKFVQIMEFAKYDLFAIVMNERLNYLEICCYFKQIINGIKYLHNIGLCHRDLKLDNLVVNENGIVKIIDFGTAVIYKSPYGIECNSMPIIMSKGVVGSDPYLPPELYIFDQYDPRPADIWSIGIIFICMILKSFPWKYPRLQDNNFKNFCLCRNVNTLNELVTRTKNDISDELNESYDEDGISLIGPIKLFSKIPEECHKILFQIVDPSPVRRPNVDEILQDSWIKSIEFCHKNHTDTIVGNKDHSHAEVDPNKAHIADLKTT